jgi:hypothetical protein
MNQPIVPPFLMSAASGQENGRGLIPTAMPSLMSGRMMPLALEKREATAPKTPPRGDSPEAGLQVDLRTFRNLNHYGIQINRIESR